MISYTFKDKVDDAINNLADALDAGLAVLDKDLTIIWVNKTLPGMLNLHYNPVGRKCHEVYKCECQDSQHCSVFQALTTGEKMCCEINLVTEKGGRKYIRNITTPIRDERNNITHLFKLSLDVTQQEEKIHRFALLRKLAELMQGTLQIDRLLHLILTCVTAGPALGFNRARLFLVEKERNIIYGKMAVGPSSLEEANKIWAEITDKYKNLEDLIKASEESYRNDTPLNMITRLMAFSLTDEKEIVVSCIKLKKVILEKNAFSNPDIDKKFVNIVDANEFVCVPLVVKDEAIGVICADNIYNRKPITTEQVELLSIFANRAALAIANAEVYRKLGEKNRQLRETRERLVRSERLAVIGNMAAYIAHEIRNPLVTIGGFARILLQEYADHKRVKCNAEIIVEEVNRLENILANIMDFSKPVETVMTLTQINELLESTCSLMRPYFKSVHIQLVEKFNPEIPKIIVDQMQMKQVFINLIKNAAESMPQGGTLTIETNAENESIKIDIIDTGEGMSPKVMQNLFVPFFTTKIDGTGVGLAVSQKIIDDHNGFIKIKSELKEGTTVSIFLPIKSVQA
ncbi:Sensor protein ZraS [Candidatus Brocadiaceae bacterium B188]|nr:PAS domain-containing protein [Candidatus Brocadia sapporoensis]QQR67183.1 MAG: PAS domain-containing protein [Candidatus Brocadia sp.]RZV56740.1 MAG: GAF domain-containing protein [Candidatus Brocadia sp. BROELEC01]TWU54203.1 Sensor protein ZraS [Candidatus Brocadiaceae bacterium B188]